MSYSNNIAGWISEPELQWLYSTAKEMATIIEVGSWKGRSTHALLSGCPGIVWAVDHFEGNIGEEEARKEAQTKDIHAEFMANVGPFPNLRLLKMASLEAAKHFEDKSVDMVFIDGDHRYGEVKDDLIAWFPKAKKLICGHDYCWPSVKKAVDEIFGKPDFLCESIWARRIR